MVVYTEEDAEKDAETLARQVVSYSSDSLVSWSFPNAALRAAVEVHQEWQRSLVFAKESLGAEMAATARLGSMLAAADACTTNANARAPSASISVARQQFASGQFPIVIPVSELAGSEASWHQQRTLVAVEKQLKKDIERDRLVVNSQFIIGAGVGVEGVRRRLNSACELVMQGSGWTLSDDLRRDLCEFALFKASRTQSGGMALLSIQALVDLQENMLIPQPDSTPPVRIDFRLGAAKHQPEKWGVVAQICCEFAYLLRSFHQLADDPDQDLSVPLPSDKKLVVVYEDSVVCELRVDGEHRLSLAEHEGGLLFLSAG